MRYLPALVTVLAAAVVDAILAGQLFEVLLGTAIGLSLGLIAAGIVVELNE